MGKTVLLKMGKASKSQKSKMSHISRAIRIAISLSNVHEVIVGCVLVNEIMLTVWCNEGCR